MKKLIALSLLFVALRTNATINVDLQLDFAGKTIQRSCVFTNETPITLEQDDITIDVIAHSEDNQAVVAFKIFKNQNDQKVLIGSPVIKTELGKIATLMLENGEESMTLQTIVTQ